MFRASLGLIVACPFLSHDESAFLEGARRNGATQIRGTSSFPAIVRLNGGPAPYLRTKQMQHALHLSRATRHLRLSRGGKRFGRVLKAYRAGLSERSLDTRLHQFVRCIEGFVGSWRMEDFADRTLPFVQGISRDELLQMYRIRSAVEHLSGWMSAANVKGERGKELVLVERAIQSQAIAQFFVSRFVATPTLWPHYATDADVKASVKALESGTFAASWGAPLDMQLVTGGLNIETIRSALDRPR